MAGKYRIERVVGEGGMGVVYAAHHLVLNQRVALKLLLVDAFRGDETVERFVREAQAAARLRSEHVVRVTDAGALDSGLPFLVMEFLQGCDLGELLRLEGRIGPQDCADYLLQALAALAQAHAAGIVHRDLKPANLFLALREDGSNVLKVLDFGISKQKSEGAHWKELTGKAVLGTPAYMSPEQLRSSKNVDVRADIWSLGIVMYELLTGRLPFDGEAPGEIFAAILEKTPARLRSLCPDLPRAWEEVVARCIDRDPDKRFQSASELAKAVAPLASGRWGHLLPVIRRSARSEPPISTSGVALVQAAVAAAASSLPPPLAARSDRPRSTIETDKTLFAEVVPVPVETAPPRRRVLRSRWAPLAAGFGCAAIACATFAVHHPARPLRGLPSSAPVRAAAVSPLPSEAVGPRSTVGSGAMKPGQPATTGVGASDPLPAEVPPSGAGTESALGQSDENRPALNPGLEHGTSTGPSLEIAAGSSRVEETAAAASPTDPSPPAHLRTRTAPRPAIHKAAEARPKFLKSWR